jgi:protein ImuB
MRRHVSVWFPYFAIDRWHSARDATATRPDAPFALIEAHAHGPRLAALDTRARAAGLTPGRPLGEARAIVPALVTDWIDAAADEAALARFAQWAQRWTPLALLQPPDGLALDVTGCAHLFGGESRLLRDLRARFRALGFTTRAAIADTEMGAWMQARWGVAEAIPRGALERHLLPLPVEALQPDEATRDVLRTLGIRTVCEIDALPRAGLGARFPAPLQRLDAALGRVREPGRTQRPAPRFRTRLVFAEPIATREAIDAALARLLAGLTVQLEREVRGVRRLDLIWFRVDGSTQTIRIDTSAPTRNAVHLERLFRERLDRVEPGFGIDAALLVAPATEFQPAHQLGAGGLLGERLREAAPLIDRLQTRLGAARVLRPLPFDSHLPERAVHFAIAAGAADRTRWPVRGRRPLLLLPRAEPIETVAQVPDHPPLRFTWRNRSRRVLAAEGPERIEPEWWTDSNAALERLLATVPKRYDEDEDAKLPEEDPALAPDLPDPHLRDYYRVQADDGGRYWLFRVGLYRQDTPARWYMHGVFA